MAGDLDVKPGLVVRLSADTIRSHVKHEARTTPDAYVVIAQFLARYGQIGKSLEGKIGLGGIYDGEGWWGAIKVIRKIDGVQQIYMTSLRRAKLPQLTNRFKRK